MRHRPGLALILLCLLAPRLAGAWGAEGHRIVGDVADALLEPVSRAAVRDLTGGQSLAEVATWMDEERPALAHSLPGSSSWHYDDLPVCPGRSEDFCPRGNCASHALEKYRAVLADRHASPADRLLALRIVVHLMGDIHQPMHMADHDDRGGNEVTLAGEGRHRATGRRAPVTRPPRHSGGHSLHSAWDVDFVRSAVQGESESEFAADLIAEHARDLKKIESGLPAQWMAESHTIAVQFAYGRLPGFACGSVYEGPIVLPEAYRAEAARIVRERLADAGIRLAVVLRAALGGP
jgi:hypothetical protein